MASYRPIERQFGQEQGFFTSMIYFKPAHREKSQREETKGCLRREGGCLSLASVHTSRRRAIEEDISDDFFAAGSYLR